MLVCLFACAGKWMNLSKTLKTHESEKAKKLNAFARSTAVIFRYILLATIEML